MQRPLPPTALVTPIECVVAPANNTISITFHGPPDIYSNGIVAVFSSTGCFTKTSSATAFFKARGAMRVEALAGALALFGAVPGWAQSVEYGPGGGVNQSGMVTAGHASRAGRGRG